MRPAIPSLASRGFDGFVAYRWEIWLLIATPLVGELTFGLLTRVFEDEVRRLISYRSVPLSDAVILGIVRFPPVLLLNAGLLLIIHRTRKRMLTTTWFYVVVVSAVMGATTLVADFVRLDFQLHIAIAVVPPVIIMAAVASKAASISYPHALSMVAIVGVVTLPGNVIPTHIIYPLLYQNPVGLSIVLIVGRLSIQMLGVWTLVRTDGYESPFIQTARALMVMALTLALWEVIAQWEGERVLADVRWLRSAIVSDTLTVAATYGFSLLVSFVVWRLFFRGRTLEGKV